MDDLVLTAVQKQTLIDNALAVIKAWAEAERDVKHGHETMTGAAFLLLPLAQAARSSLYDILAGSEDQILKTCDAIIVTVLLDQEQKRLLGGWSWANGGEGALSANGVKLVDLTLDWPALVEYDSADARFVRD